jgi:spore coat protein U-like protein
MKSLLRWIMAACTLLAVLPAWSAINCTIVASPVMVKGIYINTANLDVPGTFTVTCTRNPATDPRKPDIWVGLAQATTGETALQEAGVNTLAYTVAHRTYASGIWTSTGGGNANSTNNQAVTVRLDFGNSGATVTQTFNYYFRVALSQVKPAGVYVDTMAVTLRLGTTAAATVLNTTTLGVALSIPKSCRFSTPPAAVTVNYPAFSAVPVTGASNFAMTCTQGTTYTIALDATRGLIPNVQLAYGLSLSAAAATGTAVSQGYTVNISVDAGQAGRCIVSTCNGTDSRTLTVTY